MTKNTRKIALFVVLLMCIPICLSGCASERSKLSGRWVCQESMDDYPDEFLLNKDGTGMGDGMTFNWMAADGEIVFTFPWRSVSYRYKLSRSTLYLDGFAYDKR